LPNLEQRLGEVFGELAQSRSISGGNDNIFHYMKVEKNKSIFYETRTIVGLTEVHFEGCLVFGEKF
jgi:hypothetical protein